MSVDIRRNLVKWLWAHYALQKVRIKDIKDKVRYKETLLMLNAMKHKGLEIFVVTGHQGIGKSAYTLKVLDELFSFVIEDVEERDRCVLDHIFFDPAEAFKQLIHYKVNSDIPLPVIVFDDAGVWFTQKMFWIDRKRYFMIYGLWQFARSHVSNLVLTTPSYKNIPKDLRASGFIWLNMMHNGGPTPWIRMIKVYRVYFSFDRWIYKPQYITHVPNIRVRESLWEKYEPIRDSFVSKWEKVLVETVEKRTGLTPIEVPPHLREEKKEDIIT